VDEEALRQVLEPLGLVGGGAGGEFHGAEEMRGRGRVPRERGRAAEAAITYSENKVQRGADGGARGDGGVAEWACPSVCAPCVKGPRPMCRTTPD